MKKKIDNVEYDIIPIPPYLSPFATKISQLAQQKPASFEEAEHLSADMKKCMDKIFSELVSPQPKKAHTTQVFNALLDLTNKVDEEAGLFRQPKRRNTGEGSSPGDTSPQTTE